MTLITRDKITYRFSPDQKPVAMVEAGETVDVQTHDCFTGQLKSEKDLITEIDFAKVNPATGPIAINGAKPGDLLTVEILDI
ncbi:MAG: acetamidase/formamidase family protein, partial [Dethiobacteria bacterium]